MKKVDVMKSFSAARGTCEMVTHLLRTTANRVANQGEEGPDPASPWLIPLTPEERRARIMDAWYWSRQLSTKARRAEAALQEYIEQEGITISQLDEHGRKNGWL